MDFIKSINSFELKKDWLHDYLTDNVLFTDL